MCFFIRITCFVHYTVDSGSPGSITSRNLKLVSPRGASPLEGVSHSIATATYYWSPVRSCETFYSRDNCLVESYLQKCIATIYPVDLISVAVSTAVQRVVCCHITEVCSVPLSSCEVVRDYQ
jgi:hypothetical protein